VLAAALLFPAASAHAQDPAPADPGPDPTVSFVTPLPGGKLGAGVPAMLEATTSEGISYLAFQVDGVPVCVLQHIKWCRWTPGAGDLGPHKIQATVGDAAGRTATMDADVVVARLTARRVTAKVARKRVGRRAWRLATKGTVALPLGLTPAVCAGGRATIAVRDGRRTLVDRTVPLSARCGFASTVSLRVPRSARRLKVAARFEGTPLLGPRDSATRTVRLP
jgi:hypothetical protein